MQLKFTPLILLVFILFAIACKEVEKPISVVDPNEKEDRFKKEVKAEDTNLIKTQDLGTPNMQEDLDTAEKPEFKKEAVMNSTKQGIKQQPIYPSFTIDTSARVLKGEIDKYQSMQCEDKEFFNQHEFNLKLHIGYKNSSAQTRLTDGKSFCLKSMDLNEAAFAKLIYSRNEGGHTSDQISIVMLNEEKNKLSRLPLSYSFKRDGYELVVESKWKENKVVRKLIERYGWPNLHPDSLAYQPRKEILQTIEIKSDGEFETLEEQVQQFNMDK